MKRKLFVCAWVACVCLAGMMTPSTSAQYARPEGVRGLPQEFEYQKQLRAYWATLTESDFAIKMEDVKPGVPGDLDDRWRNWALSLDLPRVGGKRSMPSITMPAHEFVLTRVESPTDQTVIQPGVWPEPLAWIANWDRPGNPYLGSKAAKLRAFVTIAQDLMMVDEQHEHSSKFPMWRRADWFGPHLLMYASTWPGVKDAVAPDARKAFEAGLKKIVLRVCKWGPKGEETYLDMTAVTGLVLAEKSLRDPEVTAAVDAYTKLFFTPGEFYHPAGYFADQGCFDPGFNGLSLYFATWAALASDRPWIKEAVAQAWKLRGYLQLPEPDAEFKFKPTRTLLGPTHMTLRTASPPSNDQWQWPFKPVGGAYLTDDAMCQVAWPNEDELLETTAAPAYGVNAAIHQNPQDPAAKVSGIYIKNEDLRSTAWAWRMWPQSGDFPMTNFAYDFYPKGFAARRAELLKKKPELFKLPFERAAAFNERFGDAFTIVKSAPGFGGNMSGFILHTGPVSKYPGKELLEFPNAPYGLSGGTLSAYWTTRTGSVILGSRGGMHAPGGQPTIFDKPESWRNWPVHAVIGTVDGKTFFTSARIQNPVVEQNPADDDEIAFRELHGKHHKYAYTTARPSKAAKLAMHVRVSGPIPAAPIGNAKAFEGKLKYSRSFAYNNGGLCVTTRVGGDGADQVKELYEAIPVFHREAGFQPDEKIKTRIEFQTEKGWGDATDTWTSGVVTIRLTRFKGAVIVRLDRPRRMKLSPAESTGGFLAGYISRNVLIDLLENNDQPAPVKDERVVSYTLNPEIVPGVWPEGKGAPAGDE